MRDSGGGVNKSPQLLGLHRGNYRDWLSLGFLSHSLDCFSQIKAGRCQVHKACGFREISHSMSLVSYTGMPRVNWADRGGQLQQKGA